MRQQLWRYCEPTRHADSRAVMASTSSSAITSPRQSAQIDHAFVRCALEIEYQRRQHVEADPALGLLGENLTGKGLPATVAVERHVVRLAEQQRKISGAFVLQCLDGGVEGHTRKPAATERLVRHHATDAADAPAAPIPRRFPPVDADVADQSLGL